MRKRFGRVREVESAKDHECDGKFLKNQKKKHNPRFWFRSQHSLINSQNEDKKELHGLSQSLEL